MRIKGLVVTRSGGALALPAGVRRDDGEADANAEPTTTEDGMPIMDVRFSKLNEWYRIDSFWEGSFLERIAPGAFKKTLRENGLNMRVLFNHGSDFSIGDKVLGVPTRAVEEEDSPVLTVPLLDTSYNRDLIPGLRAGAYGSSFMFESIQERWNNEPEASDHNPEGLPERTITEVRTFEAGPVTWPANPGATAALRGSDAWMDLLQRRDPARFDAMVNLYAAFRAGNKLTQWDARNAPTPAPDAGRHAGDITNDAAARTAYLRQLRLAQLKAR